MYKRSSVGTLPVAAGANGQPPMPPILASRYVTPALTAAYALASPVLRVLWKVAAQRDIAGDFSHTVQQLGYLTRDSDTDAVRDAEFRGLSLEYLFREIHDTIDLDLAFVRAAECR